MAEGARELIRLPSEAKLINEVINQEDFVSVYAYLAQRSVKWYQIGVYLKLPKANLDEIRVDCPDTPTKLAHMIDTWINNSLNRTWRVLIEAVKSCDPTQTTITVAPGPNGTLIRPSGDFWENKLKELSKYCYDDYMIRLRAKLEIPNNTSDEVVLKNIELYMPNTLFPYVNDFHSFASIIKEIITRFKQNQDRLEERASSLITDMNMVSEKIQNLKIQKEKESDKTKVRDIITQELDDAHSYEELLHHGLQTSLDNMNESLKETENLKKAAYSIKKYFKGIAPLPIFIFTPLGLLTLLLLTSTLTSIIATIFITGLVLVGLKLAYDILPRVKSLLNELPPKLHMSMHLAKRQIFISYAICGAIATSILEVSVTQARRMPPEHEVSKLANSGLAKTEWTLGIVLNYSSLVVSLIVGIILGSLARLVVQGLKTRVRLYAFIAYNLIFFILAWKAPVANLALALIGAAIGVFVQNSIHRGMKTIATITAFLVGSTLVAVIWGTGIFIGVYHGEHISQHEIIHIITAATGGALGGVFSLALIRSTIFPFYYIDLYMAESIQYLNKNTKNLKDLKQTKKLLQQHSTS